MVKIDTQQEVKRQNIGSHPSLDAIIESSKVWSTYRIKIAY